MAYLLETTHWVLGTAAADAYGTDGMGGTSATNTAGELTGAKAPIPFTGATWAEAGKTITKTGFFAEYSFVSGDYVIIASGTGATAGRYAVASKTSANVIVLATSIGAGADGQTNIVGTLYPDPTTYRLPLVEILGYSVNVVAAGAMSCIDGNANVIPGLTMTLLATSNPGPYMFPAPIPWRGQNLGIRLAAGITASLMYRVIQNSTR